MCPKKVKVPTASRDINPRKSPGIDGLPSGFFRQHWDILGDGFVSLCLDLLCDHADMDSVNETVIVLIPKVDKPTSMRQLRPISLCTVIYKMVSKVLVNRMKSVLPNCISSTQAAFVQGRAITDNILIAHELVHTLHTSVSRSSQGAIFKLDMEKAFDRVEWPFLKAPMVRLRGTLSEAFLPRRGLRQGDPLSPFLFLFCTEGLSAKLTAAQREGRLPGVRASKHGPPVNHLLFADDSLVFLRNDMSEVHCLKDILSTYSAVSGQKVNFSKSTAYFSPRTPPEHRVAVHEALGVQEVSDPGIYLGVPLLIGKNKYAAFGRYRDKMDTRVSKWSNLLLSFSGREVLIKSIAQALPQYIMSCYLLPCSLVEEMSRSIRRFWWSGKGSARGWPFVAWADLCQPKAAGGMGFKDLHLFNIALLGKQLLRLLSEPGSLLYRTFRAKYFPDGDLLHASVPARSSFAWKGLHRALSRLRDGFFWTLGIDSQVHMFCDRWGGFSPVALSGSSADNEEIPFRCREFMIPGKPLWNHSKLLARLSPADVEKIVELPAVPKVRSFGWRCGRDALPVGSRLRDAGLSDGACPLCGASLEDTLHALRDCPDSTLALRQAGFDTSLLSSGHDSVVGWLDFATSVLSQRSLALLLTLLRGLWRRRNTWVHERTLYPLHLVIASAVSLCHDFVSAFAPPPTPPTDAAPTATAPPRWRPPPAGSVKINVDGAFLPSARLGAIGVLARDSSGAVLGGFAQPIPALGPASAVEASALFAGLEYAIARGWTSVLVESDAAVLVNKLLRPTPDLSLLGGLLAPSRNLIAASCGCLRVGFAPRSANSAAHTLASWACQYNDVISFTSVCPELLSRIVLDDLSSSF
ncbi:hypothetical protein V6N13_040285 [Hibiscus sabdariffa]